MAVPTFATVIFTEILLPILYRNRVLEIEAKVYYDRGLNFIQVCINNTWVDFKRQVSGHFKLAQQLFKEVEASLLDSVEYQLDLMFS